ncbi:MAG: hypothetical protein ACRDL5_16255 [Solirubrobacteraceae bacterium]
MPSPGRIEVTGAVGRRTIARSSARTSGAGIVHLTVKLSAHERRLLARRHRVEVHVSVTYTPLGGKPRTVRAGTVTLRLG